MRGTFANVRLRNRLVPGVEGGYHPPPPVRRADVDLRRGRCGYKREGIPLIVLAGQEYGTGSSRDWAAKGPSLLGIRAVIAESYERIHRSNLIGMGVLPLQFDAGQSAESLGLTGEETFEISGIAGDLEPGSRASVRAVSADGTEVGFEAVVRLDTEVEAEYYRNGGILQTVLRQLV